MVVLLTSTAFLAGSTGVWIPFSIETRTEDGKQAVGTVNKIGHVVLCCGHGFEIDRPQMNKRYEGFDTDVELLIFSAGPMRWYKGNRADARYNKDENPRSEKRGNSLYK